MRNSAPTSSTFSRGAGASSSRSRIAAPYDLDAHMKLSGKDLRYFDEASKAHYTPILIESSAGMDRTALTMLIDAYENETTVDPENGKETKRVVLHFHPKIAPVQVGIFPLARNKPELVERAQRIERGLRPFFRHAVRRGERRPALPPSRRDRYAGVHHGRLRHPHRRLGNRSRPRHDAPGPTRRRPASRLPGRPARIALTIRRRFSAAGQAHFRI